MSDQVMPKKVVVIIGIRELEPLDIYPLSLADQFDLGDIVDSGIRAALSVQGDVAVATVLFAFIKEHACTILSKVTGESDSRCKKLLSKITNDQFVEICRAVYEMNFKVIVKNVQSLLETAESVEQSASGRPSPMSLSDIQGTGLSTSQGSASLMEE